MRVLVTGASGLLGTWLLRLVPSGTELVAVQHAAQVDWPSSVRADLRDPAPVQKAVEAVSPEVVIHAAYQRDRASIVDATRNIAQAVQQVHARLILLSTDAVFSGDGHPRSEQHVPDPIWDYGRWKAESEISVLSSDPRGAVVRLPLLISVDPPDQTMAKVKDAVRCNESVGWYDGERRQPAWAHEVAATLWRLVLLDSAAAKGVWHLPGPERLLRRDLGARAAALLGVDDPGLSVPAPPPSQRPHDLHLTGDRAQRWLAWNPSPVLMGIKKL